MQFAFQAPCCCRWFDCSECHFELSDHRLAAAAEIAMVCRTCETPFRKNLTALGVEDEACPHCAAALVVPVRRPPAAFVDNLGDSTSVATHLNRAIK